MPLPKAALATLLSLLSLGSARASENDARVAELDRLEIVRAVHRAQENTGFVFLLAHRGEVVLRDVAGFAVLEHEVPMTFASRFPVMSVTKAFTGLALATAVLEGLVSLDKPLSTYLPDYRGQGADLITLRQLALHRSGVPHRGHPERRDLYVRHYDSAGAAREAYEDRALLFEPGTDYAYSSSGYNLIAAVIERQAGVNWKDYVRRKVIEPLNLETTDFDDVLTPRPEKVRNYSFVDVWAQPWQPAEELQLVPTWDFSYNLGGGNMVSTAGDLLAVGQALLARTGLAPGVWDLALARTNEDAPTSAWSFGWIHGEDAQGRRTVSITGATPGVQAALYVYPDHDLVFVALANSWGKGSAGAELVIGAPQKLVDRYLSETH